VSVLLLFYDYVPARLPPTADWLGESLRICGGEVHDGKRATAGVATATVDR
jgi:hypothetical protein